MGRLTWTTDTGPSRDYFRDCGVWRILILDNATRYALLDKRTWDVVCVGTKELCKAEAERRGTDR
jgi:hypothetical protein